MLKDTVGRECLPTPGGNERVSAVTLQALSKILWESHPKHSFTRGDVRLRGTWSKPTRKSGINLAEQFFELCPELVHGLSAAPTTRRVQAAFFFGLPLPRFTLAPVPLVALGVFAEPLLSAG